MTELQYSWDIKVQEMITQLEQFRQHLYQSFRYRADALMDLLDALSSNTECPIGR